MTKDYHALRRKLVHDVIRPAGISDLKVLQAMEDVPRHEFVPKKFKGHAYHDIPLAIGKGQTISQPSLVALMTQLLELKGHEKVLEIGTGSGYQAAILSRLARHVYTIERVPELAEQARKVLKRLRYKNIDIFVANGTLGLPKNAPYEAIIVTAGARSEIPKALISQLAEGGRIVSPIGQSIENQVLTVGEKQEGELVLSEVEPVRFVPLVGKYGWPED